MEHITLTELIAALLPILTLLGGIAIQSPFLGSIAKKIQKIIPGATLLDAAKAERVFSTGPGRAAFLQWLRDFKEA